MFTQERERERERERETERERERERERGRREFPLLPNTSSIQPGVEALLYKDE